MSDRLRSTPDVPFRHVGIGMHMGFGCGNCGKPSQMAGRGLRLVRGVRTWVCVGCKTRIDAVRKG